MLQLMDQTQRRIRNFSQTNGFHKTSHSADLQPQTERTTATYFIKTKKLKPYESTQNPQKKFTKIASIKTLENLQNSQLLGKMTDQQQEKYNSNEMFNMMYKRIERMKEKQQYEKQKQPSSLYFSVLNTETDEGLLPKKLNMLKQSQEKSLNLNHFNLGDKYGKVLCQGLSSANFSELKEIELKNNQFTQKTSDYLYESMTNSIQAINLKNNKIGKIQNNPSKLLCQISNKFQKQEMCLQIIKVQKIWTQKRTTSRTKQHQFFLNNQQIHRSQRSQIYLRILLVISHANRFANC